MQNTGAAFGLFADSSAQWKIGALVSFSVVALIVVSALLWKNSHSLSTTTIGLSLILGGAMGNLWDRMTSGRVVDFLDFYVGSYHWPAFNVADTRNCHRRDPADLGNLLRQISERNCEEQLLSCHQLSCACGHLYKPLTS